MQESIKHLMVESGINVDAALDFMMGSEKMFFKYLYRFLEDPTFPTLFESLAQGKKEESRIAAHSLKSITATLGLEELNKRIKAQELALKEGRWEEGLAMEPSVREEYERIIGVIRKVQEQTA